MNKARMATNFARALAAHVADGLQKVDAPEFQRRLEVCSLCDRRNDGAASFVLILYKTTTVYYDPFSRAGGGCALSHRFPSITK